ncbi:dipeptide/oligopeptide/nickel ABC transporter ATP-binding protein [Spirochaetia bacterium]|nr:dipeptide/oligopeptide/nickel ABC transporter ATP-binding protein [Spirochaetia bacterium]
MSDYISIGEARHIARENRRSIAALEKKRRTEGAANHFTTMRNPDNLVEFDNLKTYFFTDVGTVKAVDGVSFDVPRGKTVGIVGESGCGKSITSLSIMQLVEKPRGQIVGGQIRFAVDEGVYDIVRTPQETMRKIRGNRIAMIFQEPMTSLNPVLRIGHQVDEVITFHEADLKARGIIADSDKESVRKRTIEMLELVGISNAEGVYKMYPHELSGGMVQRVMISMALACAPSLIIADEPTTALDVTIQAQILDLLRDLKKRINASIMLITHDLGVVAEMADFVVVMYSGRVVERGTAQDIYKNPAHPYTLGLMKSKPVLNHHVDRLYSIPGRVPNPVHMPDYCYFRDRCEFASDKCAGAYPQEIELSTTHRVSCNRNDIARGSREG